MLKVALTGGAGTGKTTVLKMFQELGAPVIDADRIAREVVAKGQPAYAELRRAYGPEFFKEDGELNRARMASLVFADPEARCALEKIVHPWMIRGIQARLEELERQGEPLAMVECAVLFECGIQDGYDRIIVVYAESEDQVQRLADRDHREPAEISGILAAQMPVSEKVARADFVVDNRGSLEDTRRQVENIWRQLQKIILTGNAKKVTVQ
ncbi:MAG: dephospho-CoA kinase [Deltaproteobacteria bacterium]|nr:dephospho-CoA kinase [Deltaproteobacteria bacterium]